MFITSTNPEVYIAILNALVFDKSDKPLGHPLKKLIKRFDKFFFKPIENNHSISIFNNEEDDYLFLHKLGTISLAIIFPRYKKFESLKNFDVVLFKKKKDNLMNYYKNCIKKHLFVFGTYKIYIAKR